MVQRGTPGRHRGWPSVVGLLCASCLVSNPSWQDDDDVSPSTGASTSVAASEDTLDSSDATSQPPGTGSASAEGAGSDGVGSCEVCPDETACIEGRCQRPRTCLELLRESPERSSGLHILDLDGDDGPLGPLEVFCDQEGDGGGWTLVLKISSGNELTFSSPLWTNDQLLNETSNLPNTATAGATAKFESFGLAEGSVLRLQWFTPQVTDHDFLFDLGSLQTAREVFAGPEVLLAGSEDDGCHGDLLAAAPGDLEVMIHGGGHQFYGINGVDDDGLNPPGMLRLGFGSNDEPDNAWFDHYAAGAPDRNLAWTDHSDCTTGCGCSGPGGSGTSAQISANLWIR